MDHFDRRRGGFLCDFGSEFCVHFNCRYRPPQVGHRVSEGTASWSDLNDGAGGLFHKVDDGVDDLVVGDWSSDVCSSDLPLSPSPSGPSGE